MSKLDKADILEMTVSHLRQIHHQQLSAAMAASSSVVQQYREGYVECATEAVRYMEASRAYPNDMVLRVRTNLAHKMGYVHGRMAYSEPLRSEYCAKQDTSAISDISPPTTPVKVKVESPLSSMSLSPDSGFCSAFSPLLMPVPHYKRELNVSKTSNTSTTFDDSVLGHDISAEAGTSQCRSSHSSKLSLPSRVPVSVADSPSQKQVWRPF